MKKENRIKHFSVPMDGIKMQTIMQFTTFYLLTDFLKDKMARIINKMDVPSQMEIDFDDFSDEVIGNFKIDKTKLNEQFTQRVTGGPDAIEKLRKKMMKYPSEMLTFPQDIAQDFAKENVSPLSVGAKVIDDLVVAAIGWVWMIFYYDQLFNILLLTAIKWALYDNWYKKGWEYSVETQDPTIISDIFNPDKMLEPVSPEREFDLQNFESKKWSISYNGSREKSIEKIKKWREPTGHESQRRYSDEGTYRFLRSLNPMEMKEVVVHTAIRVASEFVKTKIVRAFNKYENKPKNIYEAWDDTKFQDAMIKATPLPQTLIEKFGVFICSYDNLSKLFWQIHMYWTGPAIVDPNIIKKVNELKVDFNGICQFIARDNMECMYILFHNLVSNPGNYTYVRDNAVTLLLNKYWNSNKNKLTHDDFDEEENKERIFH